MVIATLPLFAGAGPALSLGAFVILSVTPGGRLTVTMMFPFGPAGVLLGTEVTL